MTKKVTVSATTSKSLRKKMRELGIKPSETVRRALKDEVKKREARRNEKNEGEKEELRLRAQEAEKIMEKAGRANLVRAIRESRGER